MPKGCVIFDFDGVIADTETLHLAAYNASFGRHAADIGGPFSMDAESYFSRYIAYGDREGFSRMLTDAGRPHGADLLERLCRTKGQLFEDHLGDFAEPLPGVRQMLAHLEQRGVLRAICSGARRAEIMRLLGAFGLVEHFTTIVAIDDVRCGKPDPEGYNLAFERLYVAADGVLDKRHSLVIEDSAGGCAAARAAGIPVLAVATTSSLSVISRCADHAVENLLKLPLAQLDEWLGLGGR